MIAAPPAHAFVTNAYLTSISNKRLHYVAAQIQVLRLADEKGVDLHLPSDIVVATGFEPDAEAHVVSRW